MTTVLVVDDDLSLSRTLTMNLRARGYGALVAFDGNQALHSLRHETVDIVVLDLGLPDLSGVEVLKELRTWSTIPVVVLSARDGSDDKVQALDVGADDYVTKPFGVDELLARLRAALRRANSTEPVTVQAGALRIDLDAHRVWRADEEVHLTPIEWGVLAALVTRHGRLVSRRQLLQEVWGPAYDKETNYLRIYLANLRRKLEADPSRPVHLITEPGMGYRFVS